ncbi:hypothetical protein STEG23_008817, partial [Scotinomys teguina]
NRKQSREHNAHIPNVAEDPGETVQGSQLFLSFLWFWKLLALLFLFTQEISYGKHILWLLLMHSYEREKVPKSESKVSLESNEGNKALGAQGRKRAQCGFGEQEADMRRMAIPDDRREQGRNETVRDNFINTDSEFHCVIKYPEIHCDKKYLKEVTSGSNDLSELTVSERFQSSKTVRQTGRHSPVFGQSRVEPGEKIQERERKEKGEAVKRPQPATQEQCASRPAGSIRGTSREENSGERKAESGVTSQTQRKQDVKIH